MNRRRFLTIAAAFAAAPASATTRWQGRALGADADITLHAPDAIAQRALQTVQEILRHTELLFSLYNPASALSHLNQHKTLTTKDPRFHALLNHCDQIHTLTAGCFDPTIQPLWQALATGADPTESRAAIGWHRVARSETTVTLAEHQKLSFNGIAQGYATDLIAQAFRPLGLTDTLINIGEFRALGGPWRIAIDDPQHGPITARHLKNAAIATSSPAALHLGTAPHILGPQGQTPKWSTVSVQATTATLADGLSTGLCLADVATIGAVKTATPNIHKITLVDTTGDITTF